MSSAPNPQMNFMDLYSGGFVMEDEIEDFVDRWHEQIPATAGRRVPLHEFLGMSREEYEAWIHDSSVLPHIVRARMSHAPLEVAMREHVDDMRLAARADDRTSVEALARWLTQRRSH